MAIDLISNLYTPISEYKSSTTFREIINNFNFTIFNSIEFEYHNYIEFIKERDLPEYGWKIHISSMNSNAIGILKIVAEYCMNEEIDFKFIRDERLLNELNSKQSDRSSSGKFITIYPKDICQFKESLKILFIKLNHFKGPYILSDKRYKSSKVIFYRYGKINGNSDLIGPNGEIFSDDVAPYYQQPSWIKDPVLNNEEVEDSKIESISLKDGRYLIKDILHNTNSGGVYLALDKNTGEKVVIKESRPYTSEIKEGIDAVYFQKNEKNILNEMQGYELDFIPEYIDYFTEWEHHFLVTSYIDAHTLSEDIASLENVHKVKNRIGTNERFTYIYNQLNKMISRLWKLGITHGDITPENILIDNFGKLYLIDFELAISDRIMNPAIKFFATEGFRISEVKKDFSNRFKIDEEAMGLTLLRMFCTGNQLSYLDKYIPFKFLNSLYDDGILNQENKRVIEELLRDNSQVGLRENYKQLINDNLEDVLKKATKFLNDSINRNENNNTIFKTVKSSERFSYLNGDFGILQVLKSNPDLNIEPLEFKFKERLSLLNFEKLLAKDVLDIAECLFKYDMKIECLSLLKDYESRIEDYYLNVSQNFNINDGVSGVGLTFLKLYEESKNIYYYDRVKLVADYMVNEIKKHGLKNTVIIKTSNYTGFYNGFSGVPYFLLKFYSISENIIYYQIAKECIDYMISLLINHPTGTYIEEKLDESTYSPYLSGSMGLVRTINYFSNFNDEYESYINDLVAPINFKYCKNASYKGGLAGIGQVILECHLRRPDNKKYIDIIQEINEGIKLFSYSTKEYAVFSGHNSKRIELNYANGISGIISYLQSVKAIGKGRGNYGY